MKCPTHRVHLQNDLTNLTGTYITEIQNNIHFIRGQKILEEKLVWLTSVIPLYRDMDMTTLKNKNKMLIVTISWDLTNM